MARTYGNIYAPAFAAESLSQANAAEVRTLLADTALRDGMVVWINDAANQGKTEAEWKAAFPGMTSFSNAQVRVVMRVIATIAGGEFLP